MNLVFYVNDTDFVGEVVSEKSGSKFQGFPCHFFSDQGSNDDWSLAVSGAEAWYGTIRFILCKLEGIAPELQFISQR